MQIKQSSRREKVKWRVAKRKRFAFFCCEVFFCERFERNPLRGISAEMTVCIYQFFMILSTHFLRES